MTGSLGLSEHSNSGTSGNPLISKGLSTPAAFGCEPIKNARARASNYAYTYAIDNGVLSLQLNQMLLTARTFMQGMLKVREIVSDKEEGGNLTQVYCDVLRGGFSTDDAVSRVFRALCRGVLDKQSKSVYNNYKIREVPKTDKLLHRTGLRKTPQRMAILEYLKGNTSHPSAEDIYAAVSRRFPAMSVATVYNTLNTLREHRGVLELTIEAGRKRFDPNPKPHNHMICTVCGRIEDINQSFALELSAEAMLGFRLTGTHVDFYGVCPSCNENKTNGGPSCA